MSFPDEPTPPPSSDHLGVLFNDVFAAWRAKFHIWLPIGFINAALRLVLGAAYLRGMYHFGVDMSNPTKFMAAIMPADRAHFSPAISLLAMLSIVGSLIISAVLVPGMVHTALKQLRGEEIRVADLFSGVRLFWGAIGVECLTWFAALSGILIYGIGVVLTFLPAFALFFLAMPILVTDRSSALQALSRSWSLTKQKLGLYMLLVLLIGMLIAVVNLFIGSLDSLPAFLHLTGFAKLLPGLGLQFVATMVTGTWMPIAQAVAFERTVNGNAVPLPTSVNSWTTPPPASAPTSPTECGYCHGPLTDDMERCPYCGQMRPPGKAGAG